MQTEDSSLLIHDPVNITKEEWQRLKPGDSLLMNGGRIRIIIDAGGYTSLQSLTFNKISKNGYPNKTTTYTYWDLCRKALVIYKKIGDRKFKIQNLCHH